MTRRHICDVPGCGADRKRRQRICDSCFLRLPGELRVGINEAKHQRRLKDWNAMRRRAAALLGFRNPNDPPSYGAAPRISPQRSYELQQRMLGERPDA